MSSTWLHLLGEMERDKLIDIQRNLVDRGTNMIPNQEIHYGKNQLFTLTWIILECFNIEWPILYSWILHLSKLSLPLVWKSLSILILGGWFHPYSSFMMTKFDGASKGNLVHARLDGFLKNESRRIIWVYAIFMGCNSNNKTQLQALIQGLLICS